MERTEGRKLKKSTIGFLITLGILIVVSLLNWGVITGWGNVRITNVVLAGDDGKEYTALLYTPKNATNATPAPAYLCLHGYSGNARNHESWAVEYARRGFVVLSIDNYGSGDGEFAEPLSTADPNANTMRNPSNNLIPVAMAKYLDSLPYVDSSNILIGGHSMGCNSATAAAAVINAKGLILCEPMGASAKAYDYLTNVMWQWGTADKLRTDEKDLETAYSFFSTKGANVDPNSTVVETGKVYTDSEGNIYQHVFIDDMVHEAAFINSTAIGYQLEFAQTIVDCPNPIDSSNQIWMWKDVMGMIGVFAFIAFVCATLCMLLDQVPFFGSIRQPLPRNIGLRKFGFWLSVGVGVFVPFLTTYFANLGINGLFGAKSAYSNVEKGIFRLRFTNIALAVVIALTIVGGLMLILFILTDGKKQKAKLWDYGLTTPNNPKIDFKLIGKAALLSVVTILITYTYLTIQRQVLRTDFYCLFFGIRAVQSRKAVYYIPYIVIWIICFCFSAISMNVERRLPSLGKGETTDMIVQMLFNGLLNAAAVTLLVIIEHLFQTAKGAGVYGLPSWGTDLTRLWGMPLGMFVAGVGSTFCYRKTGTIWTGAFVFGTIAALMAATFGCLHLA